MPIFIYLTTLGTNDIRLVNTANIIIIEPHTSIMNNEGSFIVFTNGTQMTTTQSIIEIQHIIDSKTQENYAPILKEIKSLRALKTLIPK